MPLYEYYCEPCNGVFELVKPVREAEKNQLCIECHAESERIMSRDWAAFTFRDGFPRKIPDDGTYWHLGQKVSKPMTRSGPLGQHPELQAKGTPEHLPPNIEEIQRFEAMKDIEREGKEAMGAEYVNSEWSVNSDMPQRLAQPTSNQRVQRERSAFFEREKIKNRRTNSKLARERALRSKNT